MAVTATLVFVGHNSLRYLITQDGNAGTSVTITTTGAATPDILTDSVQGPIKKIAKVITDGYGAFAAGAQTQAKARALYLSNTTGADPAPGDPTGVASLVPLLTCSLTRAGALISGEPYVDANIDGSGNPTLVVTTPATASSYYLDISAPNTIGA